MKYKFFFAKKKYYYLRQLRITIFWKRNTISSDDGSIIRIFVQVNILEGRAGYVN